MADYTDAMKLLQQHRQDLVAELGRIDTAVRALGSIRSNRTSARRKPHFSAAARERIAAAQRARWKKLKAAQKK